MQLFYNSNLTHETKTIFFDKKESGHIIKSLRKVNGDILHITNGLGYLFNAKIKDTNPNKCTADILDYKRYEKPGYELHLAVAPTKRNERFEWFLEKATEIGITKITPIICERSERRHVKQKRFYRVLESAMKQSLQTYLPELSSPPSFSDFIKQDFKGQRFIAHCEEDKKFTLKDSITPAKPITILIGPEGDFSPEEIKQAIDQKFIPVSLGNNRLRTETAAIVACHTVSLANQE